MPHHDEQSLSQFLDLLANDGCRRVIVIGSGQGDEGCVDDIYMSESPTEDDELDPNDVEGVRDTYGSIEPLLDLVNHTQWEDNQGGNFRIVLTCPEATNEWELDQDASYVQLNESVPKTRPFDQDLFEPETLSPALKAHLQSHFLSVRAGTAEPFAQALKFRVLSECDGFDIAMVDAPERLTETERGLWADYVESAVIDRLGDDDYIENDENFDWNLALFPIADRGAEIHIKVDRVPTITKYVDEPSEHLIPVQNKLHDLLEPGTRPSPAM